MRPKLHAPKGLRPIADAPQDGDWTILWCGSADEAYPVPAFWILCDEPGFYRFSFRNGFERIAPGAIIGWTPIGAPQDLIDAAEIGLVAIQWVLESTIESHCLLNDDLTPRRETLDDDVKPLVADLEGKIERVRAALTAAGVCRG